jgi:ABC-type dipeptide/oligopeptide/nickel transport system permease component
MLGLIVRRLLMVIPTLFIVTFGVFLLVKLTPTPPRVISVTRTSSTRR